MPTIWIPALLRPLTSGQQSVKVAGLTLRDVIENLEASFPGIKAKLCQGEVVRPGLSVVVDGQIARGGLSEPVREDSEVHFIPAIAGGQRKGIRGQESGVSGYPPAATALSALTPDP
jgi:molybdopterin converting factor small subunit